MSKLNQIETQLKAIDQARFQRLCDAYLYRRGYEHINPLGLVIGADKVAKGTPDTLVKLPEGGYVFVEYTTQQTGVSKKFQEDLGKCFDSTKTGIPIAEIAEIVLCHNTVLDATDERTLAGICQRHGCRLTVIGIGPLAHDLYQKYPGLARDFLDVEVDTGQVVTPSEFVAAYQKSALAVPLDLPFHGREQEVTQALAALETSDLVIVSGRAGIGKSRLALEVCTRFAAAHPTTIVRCIFNRGPDLYEDLRVHLSAPGQYLILVDDANRVSRIEYVLQHLHLQTEERRVKVIVTVRDYALDKLRESARSYGGGVEVELSPLGTEQITSLVHDTFNIDNHRYLLRISEIARGNPRIAIMAARIALRDRTLESIADVTALYDEYFRSIRHDLEDLGDPQILQVAGIVSFFRAVDRSNEPMMGAIVSAFGIVPDILWERVRRLHALEVLDMYEDEVVRVSDQVLATYLFYLVFIQERALDISILLQHFHPRLQHRLADAVNGLYGAFDADTISTVLRPPVSQMWQALRDTGDGAAILQFLDVFWFIQPTEALVYLRDQVASLPPTQVDPATLVFAAHGHHITAPSLLNTLQMLRYGDEQSRPLALRLLLEYAAKRPQDLPGVLHLLINDFSIRPRSHKAGFVIERQFMDALWARAAGGENHLYTGMFVTLAATYLGTAFRAGEPSGPRSMAIWDFVVPATPELRLLRHGIWQHLFELYQRPERREDVLRLIRAQERSQVFDTQILSWDAEEVLPFFEAALAPEHYSHCLTAQRYLQHLDRHRTPFPESLLTRFRSEVYQLSELLLDDYEERRAAGRRVYEAQKQERVRAHFAGYRLEDYQRCIAYAREILAAHDSHEAFTLRHAMENVLCVHAGSEPDLFVEVIAYYLAAGDPLDLSSRRIIARLIALSGADTAYRVVIQHEYSQQRRWLFSFFMELPPECIRPQHLAQLLALYQQAEPPDLSRTLTYLTNYLPLDPHIIAKVTAVITAKAEEDPRYGYALEQLFNPYESMISDLHNYFAHDPAVLKQAYMAVEVVGENDDNGVAFGILVRLDRSFASDFVAWLCQQSPLTGQRSREREYRALWLRDDYFVIMGEIFERVYTLTREQQCWGCWEILAIFFRGPGGQLSHEKLVERQNHFLRTLIEERHHEQAFMQLVFGLIGQFPAEDRIPFVQVFLDHNQRLDDFQQLWMEPRTFSWSGSAVPMYQQRIDFYESLLPLVTTFELLDHRQHIESLIQGLRSRIEDEKKHDFLRD